MTQGSPAPSPSAGRVRALRLAVLLLAAAAGVAGAIAGASLARYGPRGVRGNRIFYDAFHVHRHYVDGENVRGAWDYHVTSGYAQFRRALEDAGYDVYVHEEGRIEPGDLDRFDIFFVGEQARNGPEMTRAERREILRFVREGGGLWAVSEHTNAHQIGARFNALMAPTGIRANYDSVCEDNGTRGSRDWIAVTDFRPHPVTRRANLYYSFNGCSFDTRYGVAFSGAATFSDAWNPDARGKQRNVWNGDNVRQPDEPMGPFPVIAARTFGRGRIVAICDHNGLANANLRDGSHTNLLLDGMSWLGRRRLNPDLWLLIGALVLLGAALEVARRTSWWRLSAVAIVAVLGAAGALAATSGRAVLREPVSVLFLDAHGDGPVVHMKDRSSFGMLVKQADKNEGVQTWTHQRLADGHDVVVLPGPRTPFSDRELAVLDRTLKRGRSVVYLATRPSITSAAGRQLARRYEFEVRQRGDVVRGDIVLEGDRALRGGSSKLGLRNTVSLSEVVGPKRSVRLVMKSGDRAGDFVTELPRRGGRFIVVAPGEAFETGNMTGRTKRTLLWIDLVGRFFRWAGRPAS